MLNMISVIFRFKYTNLVRIFVFLILIFLERDFHRDGKGVVGVNIIPIKP